jgi:hypothetical protein
MLNVETPPSPSPSSHSFTLSHWFFFYLCFLSCFCFCFVVRFMSFSCVCMCVNVFECVDAIDLFFFLSIFWVGGWVGEFFLLFSPPTFHVFLDLRMCLPLLRGGHGDRLPCICHGSARTRPRGACRSNGYVAGTCRSSHGLCCFTPVFSLSTHIFRLIPSDDCFWPYFALQ